MTRPPLVAGRYRLDTPLGRGATGAVWRGLDLTCGRDVAVKIVPADLDDLAARRFARESSLVGLIDHPNVVATLDAGREPGRAWLAMELLDGPSLATLLKDAGPLDLQRALACAEGVARGLAAAHAAGVVHRDIKPGNVVLHCGEPRIVDFGIATHALGGETLALDGFTTGTAAYLSPEQAAGRQVGTASDMYSFGCLLFSLLTGDPPFLQPLAVEVAAAHVLQQPPRLSERAPGVPPALDDLVARLLAKDPAARPDARAAADALHRMADAAPRRWRRASAAAAAVVLAAVGAAATLLPASAEPAATASGPGLAASAPAAGEADASAGPPGGQLRGTAPAGTAPAGTAPAGTVAFGPAPAAAPVQVAVPDVAWPVPKAPRPKPRPVKVTPTASISPVAVEDAAAAEQETPETEDDRSDGRSNEDRRDRDDRSDGDRDRDRDDRDDDGRDRLDDLVDRIAEVAAGLSPADQEQLTAAVAGSDADDSL